MIKELKPKGEPKRRNQRRIQSISANLIAKGLISIEELAAKVADIEQRKDVLP